MHVHYKDSYSFILGLKESNPNFNRFLLDLEDDFQFN